MVEHADATGPAPGPGQPVRLEGRDAVWLHLTLAAGLALCGAAFTVELWRALDGHGFSWMYVFEWPIFAGFALYMWWHLLHGTDRVRRPDRGGDKGDGDRTGDDRGGGGRADPAAADEKLEAWNRYVRHLESGETTDSGPG